MEIIYIAIGGALVLLVLLLVFSRKKKTSLTPTSKESSLPSPLEGVSAAATHVEIKTETKVPEEESTLRKALSKTEESFFGRIRKAISSSSSNDVIDQIEEILYTSDLGPKTVEKLLSTVRDDLSKAELHNIDKVKQVLKFQIDQILEPQHSQQLNAVDLIDVIKKAESGPTVMMILGVNGAGKTTSIGKMTALLAQKNKKVLVAAGDTFRAAAGGQLKVWTERARNEAQSAGYVEIFWPENVTDPAAVAFDAVSKAKAQNFDYLILDTAGRLHTQAHLMEELKKVKRVMNKVIPEAPHNTWIVLDANSGQNALNQATEFNKAMDLTGVILTKMDGTAKGGVVIGVVDQIQIPIKMVGLGEKINDLKVFNYQEYIESIIS
jgi:fused signal recognition particle receptor